MYRIKSAWNDFINDSNKIFTSIFTKLASLVLKPGGLFLEGGRILKNFKTSNLAPIGVKILLCRGSAQKIVTDSGILVLKMPKIPASEQLTDNRLCFSWLLQINVLILQSFWQRRVSIRNQLFM